MRYDELIAKVLNGKSVNAVALEMNIPQKTMDRYVKAETMPSVSVALRFAERAGVPIEEAMRAIAERESQVRPRRAFGVIELAPVAAALLIAVTNFLTPGNAEAAPRLTLSAMQEPATLYYVKWHHKIPKTWEPTRRRPP
jgi:transcriptional regulator with XRE-family HTH domain